MATEDTKQTPIAPAPADVEPAREYFFPEHSVTVTATSLKEAESKLAVLIKADKKN